MRGYLNKLYKSVAFVPVLAFALGLGSASAFHKYHHPIKHTGLCTLIDRSGNTFYFTRPNGELFVMTFDGPAAIYPNRLARDIYYQDNNSNSQHFVKARF
jgi:hypothetical protein